MAEFLVWILDRVERGQLRAFLELHVLARADVGQGSRIPVAALPRQLVYMHEGAGQGVALVPRDEKDLLGLAVAVVAGVFAGVDFKLRERHRRVRWHRKGKRRDAQSELGVHVTQGLRVFLLLGVRDAGHQLPDLLLHVRGERGAALKLADQRIQRTALEALEVGVLTFKQSLDLGPIERHALPRRGAQKSKFQFSLAR